MSDIECPHGDDPATCPPCRRAAGKDQPEPVSVDFTFGAKFPGDCPTCHLPIYVGQSCAHLSDGRNVHEECTP